MSETPTPAELVARAHALIPMLRERQERTEAERRVSDEAFAAVVEAGLFRALLPRRYGGYELGFDTFVDLGFEVGRGCGSTGWVFAVTGMYHVFVGKFPLEAQEDVWGADPDAVACASFPPTGNLDPVAGGYRLSGRWMYCSGVDNCRWIVVGCTIGGEGEPGGRGYALVPTAEMEIEDNWQVVGLAGTGSKNVRCADLFVPAHRFLTLDDLARTDPPGTAVNPGVLYKIPLFAAISHSLCAPIMGMAQGAFDEFVGVTRARETRGAALSNPSSMAAIPTIQLRVGEAAAAIDAARLLIDRDCKDCMATLSAGRELTVEQRARNKGDLGFACGLAVRAADCVFQGGGGAGLFTAGRIQRYWRDIHAAAMHISMSWDSVGALYGRIILGQPAGPAQF